jgi:preprotein translocase subunit SecA
MLEHLRQVIGLRGYGQRDPLNEYKAEAFSLFEALSQSLREAVTAQLMRVEIVQQQPDGSVPELPPMQVSHNDPFMGEDDLALAQAGAATLANAGITPKPASERKPNDPSSWGKVGRNEECPCGSGKKFKHCHGRFA